LLAETTQKLPLLPQNIAEMPAKWLESPASISQAKASPFWPWWQQAMEAEISQFEALGVWKPAVPPKGSRPLRGRWVYKLKTDASGKPAKFKAR
jgi:hypothetical protein